jgi:exodeoxyribonuclease VII large subunit
MEIAQAALAQTMRPRLAAERRRLEAAHATLLDAIRVRLARRSTKLDQLAAKLAQLSPLRILERGYAIVSTESGILKDSAAAPAPTRIRVRLAKGSLDAEVVDARPLSKPPVPPAVNI